MNKYLMDNDFPFSPVSFYLKYLIHKNIIDLFDEHLEDYNEMLFDFRHHCKSHEEAMKVINYTISNINNYQIHNLYSFLEKSLSNNLKNYRNNIENSWSKGKGFKALNTQQPSDIEEKIEIEAKWW